MQKTAGNTAKAQISKLDKALAAEVHPDKYHAALRALGLSYRLGRLDSKARLVEARKFIDIISPKQSPYVIERRMSVDKRNHLVTARTLRIFADEENSAARNEPLRYMVGAHRITIGRDRAQFFSGYVPFRITQHVLHRIMQRSGLDLDPSSRAIASMKAVAETMGEIVMRLPLQVVACLGARRYHFGLRVADGILLCEIQEETTYYEAGFVDVDRTGIDPSTAESIFGNPERGVSRVIIAKTWIGPKQIRPEQERLMTEFEAALDTASDLAKKWVEADFYRTVNWLDPKREVYEAAPTDETADAVMKAAEIMASFAYYENFTPSEKKRL